MNLLSQIKAWRSRWDRGEPGNEDANRALNESFALVFGSFHGKVVLDYLMSKYFIPVMVSAHPGGPTPANLNQHNGQRIVVHDILERIELGQHPAKEEEKPQEVFDVRAIASNGR